MSQSSGTVYDRGPTQYATGTVSGSYYIVDAGDTFYSIGLRFGVPWQEITRANNLADDASVVPGTRLLIPGLVPVVPPPVGPSFIGITDPTPGSTVYVHYTVTVSGICQSILENRIIVRVKDWRGYVVAQRETLADPSGSWHVEFTGGIPVPANSDGSIEAEAPANNMRTPVKVHFR